MTLDPRWTKPWAVQKVDDRDNLDMADTDNLRVVCTTPPKVEIRYDGGPKNGRVWAECEHISGPGEHLEGSYNGLDFKIYLEPRKLICRLPEKEGDEDAGPRNAWTALEGGSTVRPPRDPRDA